jgi:hypothetical protein
MEEGNIGVLLHKLTKYQTLLANCDSSHKASIYNQKISQYSNKLNRMGVSQSNIRQMGGLIGGAPQRDYAVTLKKLIEIQSDNIKKKLEGLKSEDPNAVTGLNTAVQSVESAIGVARTSYEGTISALVSVIRELLSQLITLEDTIGSLALPKGVNLNDLTNKLSSIKTTLEGFAGDSNINDEYVKLLVVDLNGATNGKFLDSVDKTKHSNLLGVELRQLATMLGFNVGGTTADDAAFAAKLLNKFKNNDADATLTKLTNPQIQSVLTNLINGNPATGIKPLTEKLKGIAATAGTPAPVLPPAGSPPSPVSP